MAQRRDDAGGAGTPVPTCSRGRLRRGASTDDTHVYFRPRAEHARERDAIRYLHAWIDVHQPSAIHRNAFPTDDSKAAPIPEPCGDAGLAAFAQLCAHRLNVHRVLITIMTGSVEYVLSEASRTMSLMYDYAEDAGDSLWLGTCSFPREAGINEKVVDQWRRARRFRETPVEKDHYYAGGRSVHYLIASDVRSNEDYKTCTLAQRAPWLRFYASVPLRDATGSVIGSLSVMDNKPRYGVSVQELLFMEDSADNIAEHLEACVVRSQRQRSERLIQALGLFNSRKSSLREWWIAQDNDRIERGGRHEKTAEDNANQTARADEEFGVQDPDMSDTTVAGRRRERRNASIVPETTTNLEGASDATHGNRTAEDDREGEHIGGMDFDQHPAGNPTAAPEFVGEKPTQQAPRSKWKSVPRSTKVAGRRVSFDSAGASTHTYARCTNLLREALGAEAVVCVNAKAASLGIKHTAKETPDNSSANGHRTSSPGTGTSGDWQGPDSTTDTEVSETSDSEVSAKLCKIHGFSTRSRSTLTGTSNIGQQFGLSDKELRKMIKKYPRGKIFNFEETGSLYSSSGDEGTSGSNEDTAERSASSSRIPKTRHHREAQRLGKVMVGARTVAFYPVFDDTSESWRSAIFVWSTTPMRFFDPAEDLTYLTSFAHSLVAELSRLETLASDTAKSTFISSMSHELRSPLHGVLAGIELLQDSKLSAFQQEMAATVAVAGRTLLDTVNHILDYSKISKLTKRQRNSRVAEDASRHNGTFSGRSGQNGDSNEHPNVDLARLTEEIVETVTSGYRYLSLSKRGSVSGDESSRRSSASSLAEASNSQAQPVSVILNIDRRSNWNVAIAPGAWTRILTNIVGNSLKYTIEGMVAVELSAGEAVADTYGYRLPVTLTVRDSGIGMSEQFLENGLFTPFKQANAHSSGTGLGLSIIKQIARELRAELDVESQLGKGTTVKMQYQARLGPGAEQAGNADPSLFSPMLNARSFHLLSIDAHSPVASEAAGVVGLSVLRTAEEWLACTTSSGTTDLDMIKHAGICVLPEASFEYLSKENQPLLRSLLSRLGVCEAVLVILGRSTGTIADLDLGGFLAKPVYIAQPIGPRKLRRALHSSLAVFTPRAVPDHEVQGGAGQSAIGEYDGPNEDSSKPQTDSFPWNSMSTDRFDGLNERSPPSPGFTLRRRSTYAHKIKTSNHTTSPMSPPVMTPSVLNQTQDQQPETPTSAVPDTEPTARDTVLLVEDNELNMRLLVALMKKLKLHYQCAANGLKALTYYTMNPSTYFLVLMDVDMPVMNGNISTKKIREFERRHGHHHTSIVALTGVTSAESRKQCFDAGMNQFFTKPIRMKDLSALVAEVKDGLEPE